MVWKDYAATLEKQYEGRLTGFLSATRQPDGSYCIRAEFDNGGEFRQTAAEKFYRHVGFLEVCTPVTHVSR